MRKILSCQEPVCAETLVSEIQENASLWKGGTEFLHIKQDVEAVLKEAVHKCTDKRGNMIQVGRHLQAQSAEKFLFSTYLCASNHPLVHTLSLH